MAVSPAFPEPSPSSDPCECRELRRRLHRLERGHDALRRRLAYQLGDETYDPDFTGEKLD